MEPSVTSLKSVSTDLALAIYADIPPTTITSVVKAKPIVETVSATSDIRNLARKTLPTKVRKARNTTPQRTQPAVPRKSFRTTKPTETSAA